MKAIPEHPLVMISRVAPIGEKVGLAALTIGLALQYGNFDGRQFILISLAVLAIVFFVSAFRPLELPEQNEPLDFSHLLVLVIMPKIVLIAAAVSTFGIFAFFLKTGNKGYLQPLMVGFSTTATAFMIYVYGALKGMNGLDRVLPLFYRALPFAIVAAYIFVQNMN